jgi:hypothetical protein
MQRIYVGPHDEVEVPALDAVVRRGEAVEVTAEQAALLDEQAANWAKPNTNKAKEVEA